MYKLAAIGALFAALCDWALGVAQHASDPPSPTTCLSRRHGSRRVAVA